MFISTRRLEELIALSRLNWNIILSIFTVSDPIQLFEVNNNYSSQILILILVLVPYSDFFRGMKKRPRPFGANNCSPVPAHTGGRAKMGTWTAVWGGGRTLNGSLQVSYNNIIDIFYNIFNVFLKRFIMMTARSFFFSFLSLLFDMWAYHWSLTLAKADRYCIIHTNLILIILHVTHNTYTTFLSYYTIH